MFDAVFAGMSSAFGSLGRGLVCLNERFEIRHLSPVIAELIGADLAATLLGRPASALLGGDLFGPGGSMRQGLLHGERQEGWRAVMRTAAGDGREVSVTAAPLTAAPGSPCDPNVRWILVVRPAEEDLTTGTSAPTVFEGLIARSPVMVALFDLIRTLSHSDATILLIGESGTGKEVVARAIHAASSRRSGPFVAVNCAALPEQLLEAELFGHVRGAFTGAVRDRVGRFELAAGGTLLLDEVGDMSPRLQAGLLRVLQEHTFERVGESHTRTADVRIIAATNVDMLQAVADGRFREDLYYRLRVVPIELHPLRERREDIAPLARHLLGRVGARHGRMLRLSPDALRELLRRDWPGNVRELENALEYAVAVCQGQTVHVADLPPETLARPARRAPMPLPEEPADDGAPGRQEILDALEAHRWRRAAAADALGVSRTTLWRRMRELGLK